MIDAPYTDSVLYNNSKKLALMKYTKLVTLHHFITISHFHYIHLIGNDNKLNNYTPEYSKQQPFYGTGELFLLGVHKTTMKNTFCAIHAKKFKWKMLLDRVHLSREPS
jgi:hypothetical protein